MYSCTTTLKNKLYFVHESNLRKNMEDPDRSRGWNSLYFYNDSLFIYSVNNVMMEGNVLYCIGNYKKIADNTYDLIYKEYLPITIKINYLNNLNENQDSVRFIVNSDKINSHEQPLLIINDSTRLLTTRHCLKSDLKTLRLIYDGYEFLLSDLVTIEEGKVFNVIEVIAVPIDKRFYHYTRVNLDNEINLSQNFKSSLAFDRKIIDTVKVSGRHIKLVTGNMNLKRCSFRKKYFFNRFTPTLRLDAFQDFPRYMIKN